MTVAIERLVTYRELLDALRPRTIRSVQEARAAEEIIDSLTDLRNLTPDQQDFVGLLGGLLYDWETRNEEPIDVSPAEVVRSLLEDNRLRHADLVGPVFPTRSSVSDFLAGRRPPSYDRISKLADFFHVSPAVFYPSGRREP